MSTRTGEADTLRAKAVDWQDLAGPGWLVVALDDALDALETARRDTLDEARGTVEAVDIDHDCDCEVGTLRAATEALREMAGGQSG